MAERLTLARPYAEAVFNLASEGKDLAGWSKLLNRLAVFAADARMKDLFSNPEVDDAALVAMVAELGQAKGEAQQNFLRLLNDNGRLALLPEIAELYERLKSKAEASVDVDIQSAFELDAKQTKVIAGALEKKLGKKINVTSRVDADLIGGVVVRAGDLVIDGSVKGYLADLASQLTR